MQRIVCTEFGPVSGLVLVEEPDPVPVANEVVVAVEAAGVSFVDGLIVQGRYQVKPSLPFTPGSAVAGRVLSHGDEVTSVAVGDRVAALARSSGAYASHVLVPMEAVFEVPDGVATEVAATAIESYCTLLFAVHHRVMVRPGEWVLVLGAGGGIGSAAVDVAGGLGAKVIAAASTAEKRAAAMAAGADHVIGYDDLKAEVRRLTGGGADVVIDPVGGSPAETALRALAEFGRYCVLGFASGDIPRLPANVVLMRNRSVVGVDFGDWSRTRSESAGRLVPDLFGRIAKGALNPPLPATFPLSEAGRVLGLVGDREITGKIALIPDSGEDLLGRTGSTLASEHGLSPRQSNNVR